MCKSNADTEYTTSRSPAFMHSTGDYEKIKNNFNIII